jgi:hypothetical protein
MANKYYNYAIGHEVGIIRYGSWGAVSFVGKYKVTKSNGNILELTRVTDGYVLEFSNRTGIYKKASDRYSGPDIVTVDKYDELQAQQTARQNISVAWNDIKRFAEAKDLDNLKMTIAKLESMQTFN